MAGGAELQLQRGRTRVSAEGAKRIVKAALDDRLQRGRTRVSAEGEQTKVATHQAYALQRGRTRVSAEGAPRLPQIIAPKHASTGPHSCECGRPGINPDRPRSNAGFNGAALV